MTGLRELLAAATPRPWEIEYDGHGEPHTIGITVDGIWWEIGEKNYPLIVGLVNVADELLARLEKLEAVAEAAREWAEHVELNGGCHKGCPEHDSVVAALAALAALDAKTGAA